MAGGKKRMRGNDSRVGMGMGAGSSTEPGDDKRSGLAATEMEAMAKVSDHGPAREG